MDIRKVMIFKGNPMRTKIRELIVTDTLYNQISLIPYRSRETGGSAIQITTKKGIGLTPICEEMESANGKASAAAALFVISSVNRFVMINIAASNTWGP